MNLEFLRVFSGVFRSSQMSLAILTSEFLGLRTRKYGACKAGHEMRRKVSMIFLQVDTQWPSNSRTSLVKLARLSFTKIISGWICSQKWSFLAERKNQTKKNPSSRFVKISRNLSLFNNVKKNIFLVTYGPNHKGLNPFIFYFEPRKPEFELATSNQHDYTQHLTNIAT